LSPSAVFSAFSREEEALLTAAPLPNGGTLAENASIEVFALVLALIVAVAVITLIALLLPQVLRLRRRK
jgi:hypothetical protein